MHCENRRQRHAERLVALGQEHVLAFWNQLDDLQQATLLQDLDRVPYGVLERVQRQGIAALEPEIPNLAELEPVQVLDPLRLDTGTIRARGLAALRAGQVAAVTVAGGQGTRLGYDAPKGTFPIGPLSGHSFFRLIAEAVIGASRRYGTSIPWYVMTSDATHAGTEAYFRNQDRCGLAAGQLRLFRQGSMPALSETGKLLLADRHRLALSPDGHGGLLEALSRSGHLARMQDEGTRYLSVFQVDNPMVRWFDPAFIGLHATRGADISCKSLAKREDRERLGNFCRRAGKTHCIEYSDFPDSHASARNPDGSRKYDAGNLSIYMVSVEFLQRLVCEGVSLPLHLAHKKVPSLNPSTGELIRPAEPNAIKMERFIFDVLPYARDVCIVQTPREEEFGPVKALRGRDSVETCQAEMIERACRWLEEAGIPVPRAENGAYDARVELSPLRVQGREDVAELAGLPARVEKGQQLYIS